MRRLSLGILAAALAVVLHQAVPAVGQTTAKDANKAADAWDTVKAYTVEKKAEAVAYGKKLVREIDTKVKGLEAKASEASGDAKAQYGREIKELKTKRTEVSKKLDEMGRASSSAWEAARDGFADAYKDLHEAFERAAAQFK